jgi:hypothetical protein
MVAIEKEVYVSIQLYTLRLGRFNFARFFIIWLTVFDQIMWAASACREIHKPASRQFKQNRKNLLDGKS